ncbi:MAG: hypothetical protein R8G66_06750 [Cytophagales bacterium]|nr:hypothetical protein [Cytophagales bacterium]
MKPTLRSMEQYREQIVSKFRPLLMVFAVYAMVCFLMPYLDFGLPRNMRGNMFYFLLTIGLLSFSVVTAIYFRAYKELQLINFQKFHLGLSRHLADDLGYLKEVPDYDAQISRDMWGVAYNHFEARNLLQGTYEGVTFSSVQAKVEQRFIESLRSDQVLFDGMIVSVALPVATITEGLIIGRSHPAYASLEKKCKALRGEGGLTDRYFLLTKSDWDPNPEFVNALLELDEQLRLQRLIRNDLIIVIRNGILTLAVPIYDRLWELVNWKPLETEEFLSRELLPLHGALQLGRSF